MDDDTDEMAQGASQAPMIETLLGRQSAPAKRLGEPAPDAEQVKTAVAAAVRAPDHGAIRPWRFFTIRGTARERLGELFAMATQRRAPETSAEELAAVRAKPLRAPLLIAVCAEVVEGHPKVPPVEQLVSCGAAAYAMLLAFQAMGYGAVLLTGPNVYDDSVKAAFGLAGKDAIVGFLYVGTLQDEPRVKRRPDPERFFRAWTGTTGDA